MRQLTSRYEPQQSQFECLIQGDSTHETGSFDPWIYLGGPVIKMPGLLQFVLGFTTDFVNNSFKDHGKVWFA